MHDILNNKKFSQLLESYASKNGVDLSDVTREAEKYLKEIYTLQHPLLQTIAVYASQYMLQRGYKKTIDTDPTEIKHLSKIMRRHPVAFVMTHKTYIDMIVLGVALARHGLPIPYIFSGINMSFLGLGDLGRKSGAIFIRRSFKDNALYKLVLKFFIKNLIDDKANFMWAIEGTRSRTGKVVWPKMGILKYIADGEMDSPRDVKYIPVSIVYDLIPDVDQMVKEGRGLEKSPESLMWFINYLRNMNTDLGKISIRFGEPVDHHKNYRVELPAFDLASGQKPKIPKFAFDLVHNINKVTPVTTGSLICIALLSRFALTKLEIENAVIELMGLVENHKADALVDRGKPIGDSVQKSLNRYLKNGLVQQLTAGGEQKFSIIPEQYLTASYYANMSVHHLYHRAFIELAIAKISRSRAKNKVKIFWEEIMRLRDIFKFEFFYSNKLAFTEEIENDLNHLNPDWHNLMNGKNKVVLSILKNEKLLLSQTVLSIYLEAYKVVGHAIKNGNHDKPFDEKELLDHCLFVGEEMHWQGKIHRVDSVSKPFLQNGIRLAANKGLLTFGEKKVIPMTEQWLDELSSISERMEYLQNRLNPKLNIIEANHLDRRIIPGSRTEAVTNEILQGERGPHIGAFFDLDRTLIKGFSAKEFFQSRLFSGKMTTKEIIAQFGGVLVYALGNRNFAGLAAISAKGINGTEEKLFLEVGEEVYLKHLANSIYPESRALVEAHMALGHTVAIISAATPYQVNPIARDLGIHHVMCTKMEVVKGKFTGNIVEPACWGEGKAHAARKLSEEMNLDLGKSHFYTDSNEDLPLLEIVGHPHPINPDQELSKIAYERNWPIMRFNDESRPGISSYLRTGLAVSSLIPATISGLFSGTMNWSYKDGVNSTLATIGDVGTALAGIKLVVKNPENMWNHRPAVFIFNHQSNVDLLIMAKLLRKDAVGVAKKELQYTPAGPIMKAAGTVFLDRKNKDKAIEALKPAVDTLKSGISIGIAPEGTRSYDYNLGKFKKGAFHLAMQAGVPIVPVVIKNAHDVMPRGSNFIKPSIVEVSVLKGVSTKRWTKESLDKNIKKIRKMYLKELDQKQ